MSLQPAFNPPWKDDADWQNDPEVAKRVEHLMMMVSKAGSHTLKYFQSENLRFESKKDDSPVTIADREAEQIVREHVGQFFADDTMEGEEFDDRQGNSRFGWIVDPIDGTRSFISGVPLYSTLLALLVDGEPFAGAIYIPALDEIVVAAKGAGAWTRKGDETWKQAKVSSRDHLSDAVFVVSQVDLFDEISRRDVYSSLEKECSITRSWGDGYGYLLVATGRADLMIDPLANAWDIAAISPVIEEAGGRFTDWNGKPTVRSGNGIGSNGVLHEKVLKVVGV
ncbi:MAG: histidinol-phosphatase [Planctomycetota bacterium]